MKTFLGGPIFAASADTTETEPGLHSLLAAISERSYPRIYKELRKCSDTFSPKASFHLLYEALENELTLRAITALLERCPPAPELLAANDTISPLLGGAHRRVGLMEEAAWLDRADVLALLLERGAGPNRTVCFDFSPLEAALENQSIESVDLLMKQPELDLTWTPKILSAWAKPLNNAVGLEFCLQLMAPRFTGWEPTSFQSLPIPGPMTAEIIADAENWPLLARFCRERGPIPRKDALSAIRSFDLAALGLHTDETDWPAVSAALAALLESCPALLRAQVPCRTLLRWFLLCGGEDRELLRPWVERIRRRRISMEQFDWRSAPPYADLLNRWQELLPQGPTLVIDRWSDVFEDPYGVDQNENQVLLLSCGDLGRILDACPILGKGRPGKLSPLAQAVLQYGDAALVERLFQPGGALADEDGDALLGYLQAGKCPWINRNAALACVRKEEHYAL